MAPHSSLRQLLRTSQPRCVVTEEAFPLIRAGDAPVVVWEAAWEAIATHPGLVVGSGNGGPPHDCFAWVSHPYRQG